MNPDYVASFFGSEVPEFTELVSTHLLEIVDQTEDASLALISRLEDIERTSKDFARELSNQATELNTLTANSDAKLAESEGAFSDMVERFEAVIAAQRRDRESVESILSSLRVDDEVDEISTIARATNILALNTMIEASRAGPGSEGLTVIAAEFRDLSHKIARSAQAIGKTIVGIQTAINETIANQASVSEIRAYTDASSTLREAMGALRSDNDAVTSFSRELVESAQTSVKTVDSQLVETLSHVQFQDRLRQSVEAVVTAHRRLGELCAHAPQGSSLDEHVAEAIAALRSGYVSHEQRVKDEGLSTGDEDNKAGARAIELF
ncbi:MAG: methyl-accepting chemotaxis protein [Pseudomonadota bacterium]